MFRVQENEDGSTSIFCKTNNSLICTIRGQQRGQSVGVSCRIPRPINVVEPSLKLEQGNSTDEISSEYITQNDVKPDIGYIANRSTPCISLPSVLPKEIIEDFSDDCITEGQFARCLNLVPTVKLKTENQKKLRAEFPLRLHSRTEPLFNNDALRDLKFPDDMPLTSCLGIKILQLNYSKNFVNDQSISIAIKKYDTFCRFPINSVKVSSCSFPKLRCREKKEYPICIPQKILKLEVTHKYSYGRKQRQERMLTMKTGLDKRSRKLLKQCQSRTSTVRLVKLTDDEIKKLTERKPKIVPYVLKSQSDLHKNFNSGFFASDEEIHVVDTSDEEIEVVGPSQTFQKSFTNERKMNPNTQSESDTNISISFTSDSFAVTKSLLINGSYQKMAYSNNFGKKCFVKLSNVLQKIQKQSDKFFIKGTSIQVPFLVENLMSSRNFKVMHLHNGTHPSFRDHSYYRSTPKKGFLLDSFSFRSAEKNRKKMASSPVSHKINGSPFKPFSTKISKTCKGNGSPDHSCGNALSIPVVDLTEDSPPDLEKENDFIPVQPYDPQITRWLFHCFGCGLKHIYNTEDSKDFAVNEHMKNYHSVSDPDSFLLPYIDNVNRCLIIEAFPGYKNGGEK